MTKLSRLLIPAACILIGCAILVGCRNTEKTHPVQDTAQAHHGDHEAHQESSTEELSLSLNDGDKWQMDEHTRVMFTQMVDRFDGLDALNATQEELVGLGDSLDKDLRGLIAGCTMEGAAHDELHKFLVHYLPAVNGLKSSGALEDAKRVHGLLGAYPEYFE